jgi:hypothetical protein
VNGARICSTALADSQQLLLLERLRRAGTQPVALDELRAGGIYYPAVIVSERHQDSSPHSP